MKKFFAFVTTLFFMLSLNAKQVVFDFTQPDSLGITAPASGAGTDLTDDTQIVVDSVVMTNHKVAKTATRIWNAGGTCELRIYASSTITFEATEPMTAIEFEGSAVAFSEFEGKTWIGTAESVTFTATATCKINRVVIYIGETPEVWVPDTIDVAQARALIDAKDAHDHFVVGVVAGEPYNTYSDFAGKVNFWLVPDLTSADSLQAYQVFDKNNAKWESLEAAKAELHVGDTILVYAAKLELYAAKNIYEINGGHYVEKLGGAPVEPVVYDTINVAQAILIADSLEDGAKSAKEYFIEGFAVNVADYYQPKGNQDFFLVDNVEEPDSVLKAYRAVPTFDGKPFPVLAGDKVRLFGKLQKYVKDSVVQLEVVNATVEFLDTVPGDRTIEEPQPVEGDTITVAQALQIGAALDSAAVTEKEYIIVGYVSSIVNYFDEQYKNETFWMTDEKGSRAASNKDGAFEVYRGRPNTEAEIGLDAYVFVKAKIQNFRGSVIETSGTPIVEVIEQGQVDTVASITVAQAVEIGLALADQQVSDSRYEITGYVSTIQEAYSEQYGNETFWITDEKGSFAASSAAGAFEVYRGKPNTGAEIGLDAKIRIVCKIKNYRGTVENDGSNIVFEVLEQGADRAKDTITVAQALEIGAALDSAAVTEKEYLIVGYVSSIVDYFDPQYKNETFWMADEKGSRAASNAAGAFEVYRGKPTPAEEIGLEAKVYVTAKIQNFRGSVIETSGTPAVEVVEPGIVDSIRSITVAEAVEIGLALEDQQVSDSRYEITGYVSSIVEKYSEQYKNETFWIVDEKGNRASSTAAGAFEIYRGKPNTEEEIGLFAKIKIVCKIKNFRGTVENDGMNIVFEVLEQGVEEKLDTISVAQALEIGAALDSAGVTDVEYVIKGYVSSIENYFDPQYKNETFWMADEKGSRAASNAAGAFEVYRGVPTPAEEIGLDALVLVTAKIQNFRGSVIETSGSAAVNVLEPGIIESVDTITVAQALEIGLALAAQGVTDKRYAIEGYVSSIDEPFSDYGNETFWIADSLGSRASSTAAGAFEVYRGKPNTSDEIGFDAKIRIVCKIKNYNGTIENDGMNIVFEVLEPGSELVFDTLTVARAIEKGMSLEDNAKTDSLYVVKGYAVKAYAPDSGKVYQNWWMADEPDVKGDFEAYRCTPDSLVRDNDYVFVIGKIQKYVSSKGTVTIEMGYGKAVHAEAPKMDTLSVAQALELGNALEDNTQTEDRFAVVGYVASIDIEFAEDIQSFSLSDDNEATEGAFKALNAFIDEPGAEVHNRVVIVGRIQKLVAEGMTMIRIENGKARVIPNEGIENISFTDGKAQKILHNGMIYIVLEDKIFNILGERVR